MRYESPLRKEGEKRKDSAKSQVSENTIEVYLSFYRYINADVNER